MDKKKLCFALGTLGLLAISLTNPQRAIEVGAVQASSPTSSSLSGKMTIDLRDNKESEIRSYYSSLNSLPQSERTGDNLLKNLKPILQNFNYYSYDNVWKIYEITDRDWSLSPASSTEYGSYDASSNKIIDYQFGTTSTPRNNPYVQTLYRNRGDDGSIVEGGRIRAWGSHNADGTNREHVWCQSRGFKAPSGAEGPAGTDVHHLISGDGYVNQSVHNNNPYGEVDPSSIKTDGKEKYAYDAGNILGKPRKTSTNDESTVVFEPQDCDKGDIARACFYMAACYNNLANESGVITQYNPNLTLVDYATSNGDSEESSDTHPVAMGILSDLLKWHKLDPVDEYEIHRNNLIYNNFQHNRNPFIDFPGWVDLIWGEGKGTTYANPAGDKIYEKTSLPEEESESPSNEKFSLSQQQIIFIGVGVGVVVLLIIILLVVSPKFRKKAMKGAKKQIKKSAKKKKK